MQLVWSERNELRKRSGVKMSVLGVGLMHRVRRVVCVLMHQVRRVVCVLMCQVRRVVCVDVC